MQESNYLIFLIVSESENIIIRIPQNGDQIHWKESHIIKSGPSLTGVEK